ncbi:hypothetical protein VTN96DRAFT_6955 [Rasamsonia emersonii]
MPGPGPKKEWRGRSDPDKKPQDDVIRLRHAFCRANAVVQEAGKLATAQSTAGDVFRNEETVHQTIMEIIHDPIRKDTVTSSNGTHVAHGKQAEGQGRVMRSSIGSQLRNRETCRGRRRPKTWLWTVSSGLLLLFLMREIWMGVRRAVLDCSLGQQEFSLAALQSGCRLAKHVTR